MRIKNFQSMNTSAHLYHLMASVLSSAHCYQCRVRINTRDVFCNACAKKIQPSMPVILPVTNTKSITIHTVGAYQEPLTALVYAKHYRDAAAAKKLGILVAQHMQQFRIPADYVVPIPLHWLRYAWRGFNQADIMCQEIHKACGIPLARVVQRTAYTKLQASCSAQERIDNVSHAFTLSTSGKLVVPHKHILLIDDLMTTGSTLKAVARLLLPLEPASISALVASRVF